MVVFSPLENDKSTRISLLQIPAAAMPRGLETRAAGIQQALGTSYRRVRLEPVTVVGRPGAVLEYTAETSVPIRTVEYGARAGKKLYIFQFVAPVASWASMNATFEAALASIELLDTPNETSTIRRD